MTLIITAPSELDTIAHRLDRIGRDSMRVQSIVRGEMTATVTYRNRTIARLLEDKGMLSAHQPVILERIAELPLDEQPEQIASILRPITLAIEQANIAITRLRTIGR